MDPIQRIPIVQQVEEQIRSSILEGQYQPGDKLPAEMELCRQLNVGRGTVREAFRLLQAKGFVEIKPGRGAFVAQQKETLGDNIVDWLVQNEQELRSAIEIRTALEPMAARLMAQRCSNEELLRLEDLHRSFLLAVEDGDPERIGRLDEQFHSAIVEGSRNELLIHINSHVCQAMKVFRRKTFQVQQNAKNAIEPHTNILRAIYSRDPAQAEREMRLHLDKVQEDLTSNISSPAMA